MPTVILLSESWSMEGQDNFAYNRICKPKSTRSLGSIEGCYSRSFRWKQKRVRWSGKWFKTVSSCPATLPPWFLKPPPSVPLPETLYLIACAGMAPEKKQQGVASRLLLAFRCGLCGGCFLPLWTYPYTLPLPSVHLSRPRCNRLSLSLV